MVIVEAGESLNSFLPGFTKKQFYSKKDGRYLWEFKK
jgi:hypothetical protein